jgi:hypothetical protein
MLLALPPDPTAVARLLSRNSTRWYRLNFDQAALGAGHENTKTRKQTGSCSCSRAFVAAIQVGRTVH